MIIAEKISFKYNNNIKVFENFSFSVEAGTHVCFAGPSGRGKTSVLKLLQGYVQPQKGKIQIKELCLSPENIDEIRNLITYIPQNVNLPVKNGIELIRLLDVMNSTKKIADLCGRLGLDRDILYRNFSDISGGQKQRIIIAVCLDMNKEIVLLDEPTASLDDESVEKLISIIKELDNKTFISASHNSEWIKAADKIINL